jgi:hypothetical protein
MLLEQAPSYGAVSGGKGLGANYSLNFTADLTHQIPLTGAWQGDSVKALSLFINNYENNFSLTVTGGNSSKLIPAYSTGYLDISSFDSVTITSSGAATVTVSVLNYVLPYGFDARGNSPNVSTFDNLYSKVCCLNHFDGVDGATTSYENISDAFISLPAGASLSSTFSSFGDTSLLNTLSTTANICDYAPTLAPSSDVQTIEFTIYCDRIQTISANISIVSIYLPGSLACRIVGFGSDAGGMITSLFLASCTALGSAPIKTLIVPLTLNLNQKYIFAVSYLNATLANVYMNGIFIGSGACLSASSGVNIRVGRFSSGSSFIGYFDELRITNNFRYYTQSYVLPTTQFQNS